jgi:hypothetical protein
MRLGVDLSILNQKGTPAFYSDIFANRPAFGYAGRVFISTDTGAIYEDTGSAWVLIADAGAGTTGTLQQVTTNGKTTDQGITITAGGLSTNSLTDTALTAGSVLFSGAAGLVSQDNATFFWDTTNKRLGINNASPGAPLDIHSTGTNAHFNGTGTNNAYVFFQNAGTSKWRVGNFYNAGANSFDIHDTTNATTRISVRNTGEVLITGYNTISNTPTFSSSGNYASNPSLNLTVPASSTFNSGASYSGMAASLLNSFDGSSTIGSGAVMAGFVGVNRQSFNAAGYTITLTQGASGIRAVCGMQVLQQTGGSFTGTITHGASLLVQGVYPTNATNITYTNYYGLLINQLDEYGGVTFTNRWGIYQGGASDKNYLGGNTGIGISPQFTLAGFKSLEISDTGLIYAGSGQMAINNNGYNDGSWKYKTTNYSILLATDSGQYVFNTAPSGTAGNAITFTERMRLTNTGSLGIGTSTIGSKLQVNGNAAIGYSASTAAPTNGLAVSGNVGIGTNSPNIFAQGGTILTINSNTGGGIYGGLELSNNGTSIAYFLNNYVNGLFLGTKTSIPIIFNTNDTERARFTSTGQLGIGTSTPVASSALQVASTTQGFLPPVMTTTQKNAISSPAAGLVVFDSTLAKLCVYASGAWQTITSV